MFRHIKYLITILTLCICVCPLQANAATITALSTSLKDVQSAISSAKSGDTVNVPAGSANWNTTLTLSKAVSVIGAGSGCPTACDNATTITSTGGSFMVVIQPSTPTDDPAIRISGFTFDVATRNAGGIAISNSDTTHALTKIRVDHNRILNCSGGSTGSMYSTGIVYGLIDHNRIENTSWVQAFAFRINGTENSVGTASWDYSAAHDSTPVDMGNAKFLYIEDNFMDQNNRGTMTGMGAKAVFRYNTFQITGLVSDYGSYSGLDYHGNIAWPPSGSYTRGIIAEESYENTFLTVNPYSGHQAMFIEHRAGRGMIWNNTATCSPASGSCINGVFRNSDGSFGFRIREEDQNPTCYNGLPCCTTDGNGHCIYGTSHDVIHNTYIWGNTEGNRKMALRIADYDPGYNLIAAKRDFWADSSGTTPTDYFSTGASLPGTCTTNDFFWQTDGVRTTTTNKNLWKCTAPNTWTSVYVPYQYPHPLSKPTPPQNIRITSD